MYSEPPPNNWSWTTISEIVDPSRPVTYGVVQPGPRQDQGVPIIRGKDYSSGDVATEDLYLVHPSIAAAYRRSTVRGGDLLLSIVGYVGQTAQVPEVLSGANLTQTTARIAIRSGLDLRFFLHYFRGQRFAGEVKRYTKGSAQPGLNLGDVENFQVLVPPFPEQRRIAEILDTVDEAIRMTEEIIAKLEEIEQGLLNDLLTRGIDEKGELRDPERYPEQFKDSPLGRIPRDWEVMGLESILESAVDGPFGSNLKTEHYVPEPGVRVVRLQNVGLGEFVDEDKVFVDEQHARRLQKHQVVSGDLIVASLGDERHPIGRACVYPSYLDPGIVKADCFRLRTDLCLALNAYVSMVLNCPATRDDINRLAQGVTRDRVNLRLLKSTRLRVPSLCEQRRLIERFASVIEALQTEGNSLEKLRMLKPGLMNDLLTGRVRVTVPDEAA